MKQKALLVAAKAGCVGPVINFDAGEWDVDAHPAVAIEDLDPSRNKNPINGPVRIKGKARVRAIVSKDYKGPDIHLDARQVA